MWDRRGAEAMARTVGWEPGELDVVRTLLWGSAERGQLAFLLCLSLSPVSHWKDGKEKVLSVRRLQSRTIKIPALGYLPLSVTENHFTTNCCQVLIVVGGWGKRGLTLSMLRWTRWTRKVLRWGLRVELGESSSEPFFPGMFPQGPAGQDRHMVRVWGRNKGNQAWYLSPFFLSALITHVNGIKREKK